MAELKKKEGALTTADLAAYGIPPKQPDGLTVVKSEESETPITALPSQGPYKQKRRTMMKPSTQDKVEGKIHEVKGKIKEEAGKITNDPNLEVSGDAEKKAGKVQKWIGRAEKAVGE